ncbi:hypothetical protein KFL_002380020 [Klebsormidium nitens]|uniref:Uncharacterized protein n=1 Tax=Klebsormidium nitens TaxID=105231 RepID=A0A1Y1I7T4_KLENI|nr:hypothetical protein KFL_002380020 [Klebsormidium nitens]|eukprot:GAQ85489.1 hypothetical protein KFL_002380020 [Klebsormidium nitens]
MTSAIDSTIAQDFDKAKAEASSREDPSCLFELLLSFGEELKPHIVSNGLLLEIWRVLDLMQRQIRKFPLPKDDAHTKAAVRLVFLLRLVLGADPASEHYNYVLEAVSDCIDPDGLVLGCFQTTLELLQLPNFSSAVPLVDPVYRNALQLLKEAREGNHPQWKACFSSCLRRVFLTCREHGMESLNDSALKRVLLLFSRPSLAPQFLDSLIALPECGERTKGALVLAFQIFGAAYRRNAAIIISTCAAKLVEECADNVNMRVECLAVLSRVHARWCDSAEGEAKPAWSESAIQNLMQSALFDPSVRVRRSAAQLISKLQPDSDCVAEQELLYLCFLKLRDNDEKVRRAAFRRLADFPLATLAQHFQACDWQLVFQHGFREEGTAEDVQELLYDYLLSAELQGPPSSRLALLGRRLQARDLFRLALAENIETIFKGELPFWGYQDTAVE